jgi:DNA-binding transcriptional ArsR family regulator
MMLSLDFTADDLAHTRFACSPLWEIVESLRMRQDPSAFVVHGPWVAASGARLKGFPLDELLVLVPTHSYIPDFLTPPPDRPLPDVADELDRIRATPARRVRADVARRFAGRPVPEVARPYIERPAAARDRLVELLVGYWERAIEPDWPRIRALLEREVAERARQQAAGGPVSLLGDLHPAITWRAGSLRVRGRNRGRVALGGRGLIVIPNVFAWPLACSMLAEHYPPAITYPPRGVGSLWAPEDGDAEALEALLGRTRASVLRALSAPCSTSELARRMDLTPGAISLHLTVMRRSGLLVRQRDGRSVLYRLSAIGEALLAAVGDGVAT